MRLPDGSVDPDHAAAHSVTPILAKYSRSLHVLVVHDNGHQQPGPSCAATGDSCDSIPCCNTAETCTDVPGQGKFCQVRSIGNRMYWLGPRLSIWPRHSCSLSFCTSTGSQYLHCGRRYLQPVRRRPLLQQQHRRQLHQSDKYRPHVPRKCAACTQCIQLLFCPTSCRPSQSLDSNRNHVSRTMHHATRAWTRVAVQRLLASWNQEARANISAL